MQNILRQLVRASLVFLFSLAIGCGLDSNQGTSNVLQNVADTIFGVVAKGEIANATVRVYRLTASGVGPVEGSALTDSSGRFQLRLPQALSGPVSLEASGGTYVDEATGVTLTLTTPLRTKIAELRAGQYYAVTPLTEIAARISGNDAAAINESHRLIAHRLSGQGVEAVDIATVVPVNTLNAPPPGASSTQISYGLLLAAVSQHASSQYAGNLSAAVDALAADAADGLFNTSNTGLANALTAFLNSPRNRSGVATTILTNIIEAHGNNAPVAQNSSISVAYQSSANGVFSATDANGDVLTYTVATYPAKGTLSSLTGSSFIYTAANGMTGADAFTFRANDGSANSNIATVSINIGTPNNTPPVANPGTLAVAHNTVATGALSGSDADGNAITFTIVSNGSKGTVAINNANTGAYTYTPFSGASGADSFSFSVNDGTQDSLPAEIGVSIAARGNTNPVASNGTLTVLWNTVTNGTLVATDANSDPLTYTLVTTPGVGNVSLGSGGQYTYTPGAGVGNTSFTYKVNDGIADSNTATISIAIQGGDPASGTTLFNTYCLGCHVKADKAGRSVTQIQSAINTYPSMNTSQLRALSDAQLGDVAAWLAQPDTNTAPVANAGTLSVGYNTAGTGTLSASDANNDALTYSIVTNGAKGTAVITNVNTGAYTYTPQSGQTGADSFTFRAFDGIAYSSAATISVTIGAAPNAAPVANAGTLSVGYNTAGTGTLSASDANNDALTYSIVTNGAKGTAVITNVNTGAYTYTPQSGQTGADSFTFRAFDGIAYSSAATISVTIGAAPNAAPVANAGTLSVLWNTVTNGTLSASDANGDPLTYILVTPPSVGSVSIGTGGVYTYTPGTGSGNTSFTYKVNDGLADSSPATVSITIQGGDAANGTTLFTNNCEACHIKAAKAGRTVTQIKNAINTQPNMNTRPNLTALTDAQLGDISAWLAQ